jgi:hypothetical protein
MTMLRFADLSSARKALVRLFQSLNFGQIQNLHVRNGDPVFAPPPLILFETKLDNDERPRPELDVADFALCDEVRRFVARLDELKNGRIERIEVRSGLPRRVVIERHFGEAPQ